MCVQHDETPGQAHEAIRDSTEGLDFQPNFDQLVHWILYKQLYSQTHQSWVSQN